MRASDAAVNDDRPRDAEKLFERARALNDRLIAVRIVEILRTGNPEDQLTRLCHRAVETHPQALMRVASGPD